MTHPHYAHYTAAQIKRLDGFYGLVEEHLHQDIEQKLSGETLLDIGCGFGSLCHYFHTKGYKVTGIEQHQISLQAGQKKYPHLQLVYDEGDYLASIPDNSFDVIVLKDVMHHVVAETDVVQFMNHVRRICKRKLVIIDPNPTFILRLSRKLIRHIDPECPASLAQQIVTEHGFSVKTLFYRELIAFPLSGGYVGPELVKSQALMRMILGLDRFFKMACDFFKLSPHLCWRYVLVAQKI